MGYGDVDILDAQAAADAIDAMLSRRADPVYRPLRTSLAGTLRSRDQIEQSLKKFHKVPMALRDGHSLCLKVFGSTLAMAWATPDKTLLDPANNRDCVFDGLDRVHAARVRGLLTHLEWAVKADPNVTAADVFVSQDLVRGADGACASNQALPKVQQHSSGTRRGAAMETTKAGQDQEENEAMLEEEDADWPPQVFAREFRTPMTPAQRVMWFREELERVHGTLAEGFKAMDLESRGYVAYGDFCSHLIRVNICNCDSEGSLMGMELFKLLDMDRDDLLNPRDIIRGIKAAKRYQDEQDMKQDEIIYHENMREAHNLPREADRIPTSKIGLRSEDQVRMAVLRRYLAIQHGSFLAGIRSMDVEGDGYIYKADFVHALLESGYCLSVEEGEDLFSCLDLGGFGALSVAHVEALEDAGVIPGGSESMDPMDSKVGRGAVASPPPVGVGTGGVFSYFGSLDGEISPLPPRQLASTHSPRRDEEGEPAMPSWSRLHATPTESWKSSHPIMVNSSREPPPRQRTVGDDGEPQEEPDENERIQKRISTLALKARASIHEAWVNFDASAQTGMADAIKAAKNANRLMQVPIPDSAVVSCPSPGNQSATRSPSAAHSPKSFEEMAGTAFGPPLSPASNVPEPQRKPGVPEIPEPTVSPVFEEVAVQGGEQTAAELVNHGRRVSGSSEGGSRRQTRDDIRRSLRQRNSGGAATFTAPSRALQQSGG